MLLHVRCWSVFSRNETIASSFFFCWSWSSHSAKTKTIESRDPKKNIWVCCNRTSIKINVPLIYSFSPPRCSTTGNREHGGSSNQPITCQEWIWSVFTSFASVYNGSHGGGLGSICWVAWSYSVAGEAVFLFTRTTFDLSRRQKSDSSPATSNISAFLFKMLAVVM